MDSSDSITRRGLLKTGAGVATAGAVGAAATGSASAQNYGGYLEEAGNYDGRTADATGLEEVTVSVGAGQVGLQFDPPAIAVDPGTTVHWEWTGEGGAHNVSYDVEAADVDERVFRSGDPVNDEGILYDFTFEEEHEEINGGQHPYVCEPHVPGMRAMVIVGEENIEGDTVVFGEAEAGLNRAAIFGGSAVLGTVSLLGVAAYHELYGEDE